MMTQTTPAISLQNIGKCFRIYANPQDRLRQALRDRFGGWLGRQAHPPLYREHWAVQDVSFTVDPGEAVGILGENGAGKSTLLQIIAGTLAPTTGQVETSGRITALLELGSGFNPEFTGIENVIHNGQILGMKRPEIEERLDEILAFADIGDFVHQPVKTYSSGMMMRLAFAVQTVLDPHILIVDEALAVGDSRFQEKCFKKIKQLRDSGVSILFVSHDVNAITNFCDKAVLMHKGKLLYFGSSDLTVKEYKKILYGEVERIAETKPQASSFSSLTVGIKKPGEDPLSEDRGRKNLELATGRFGNKKVEIIAAGIFNMQNEFVDILKSGEKYKFIQRIKINENIDYLGTGMVIQTPKSLDIFGVSNKTIGLNPFISYKYNDIIDIAFTLDCVLSAGDYLVQFGNAGEDDMQYDCIQSALHFTVIGTPELFTTSIVNLKPHVAVEHVSERSI